MYNNYSHSKSNGLFLNVDDCVSKDEEVIQNAQKSFEYEEQD